MPTYRDAVHGVQHSWEYLEAAAVADLETVMLNTFEFYHPAAGRHRFVADFNDLNATLEADAPDHGGEEVLFLAVPLRVVHPDEDDTSAAAETSLIFSNVAGKMMPYLRAARGSLIPWTLTERVYGTDTSAPAQLPPTVITPTSVDISGANLVVRARFRDPGNVGIPSQTFMRKHYPGLQR